MPTKLIIFLPILILVINPNFSYAEKYELEIDENLFSLEYTLDGKVLAMAIDNELNSLLVGIDETKDSAFYIDLPNELISAEDNEFAVLVDGVEVDYTLDVKDESIDMIFYVPEGAQEIEIIGTHVIPEFSSMLLGLSLMFTSIIFLTKFGKLNFT